MTIYKLNFGKSVIDLRIRDDFIPSLILPPLPSSNIVGYDEIIDAFDNPIYKPGHNISFNSSTLIGIAINDKTRPVPHKDLLPPLIDFLLSRGASSGNITFYIATGTHTPMAKDELFQILPSEIVENYQIVSHNCDSLEEIKYVGATQQGTPVYINSKFLKNDVKIVVGNIEPHHYMGFSGGVKSAAIGLAGRETINANHSHLVDTGAKAGNYYTNPCRLDVEEIGELIGVDYALNVILDTKKNIVQVLWGDPVLVMRKGIEFSSQICNVNLMKPYDIVIASAGGYPKDINLYQAQKALTNAAEITRDGGNIYLVAACEEGHGNSDFFHFLEDVASPGEVLKKFQQAGFSVGPHKAFQIAKIAQRVNIHLISEMSEEMTRLLLFDPISPELLEEKITQDLSVNKTLAIMPYAVTTIPKLVGG